MWFQVSLRCAISQVPRECVRCPTHPHGSTRQPDGEEAGAAAAGEFPKVPLSVSFFLPFTFEEFLLLNPAAPYQEGPVLSESPPLQLDWELSGSGPITAQLSTLPSWHTQSLWACHFILITSLWLQATRSLSVLLKPCLAEEGALNWALSQESCGKPGGHWAWGYICPVPRAGPRDLIVLKQSLLSVFSVSSVLLVSYLHKCWGTVGCSLCSSVDQFHMCAGGGRLRFHLSCCHLPRWINIIEIIYTIQSNI